MKTKGITTQKNTKGEITHVTVDVRQQPELKEHFTKIGVVEEMEDDFEKRWKEGSTVEEAMNRTLEKIRKLKW